MNLKREVSILCYHSIDSNGNRYSVESKDFYRQMDYLRKNYAVVSLEDILHFAEGLRDLKRKSVAITFDDGYSDNYLNAYPYFKKYGIPATIFVTTGYVGKEMSLDNKNLPTLSWSEIKIMSKNKIEIGAHTISHLKLTEIELDDVRKEIIDSKKEIEKKIGKEARFFAYPFNAYNQSILKLIKQTGLKSAVCGQGVVQKSGDVFALGRVEVDRSVSFMLFKMRLTKATSYYNKFEQTLKKMFVNIKFMTRVLKVYHNLDGQDQK